MDSDNSSHSSMSSDEDTLEEEENDDIFLTALKQQKKDQSIVQQKQSLIQTLALPNNFMKTLQVQQQDNNHKQQKHATIQIIKPTSLSPNKNSSQTSISIQNQAGRFSQNPVNTKNQQSLLPPGNNLALTLLKRNTILVDQNQAKSGLRLSLLNTLVKSQTQSNPSFMSKKTQNAKTLAILEDQNQKIETRQFTKKSLKIINFTPIDWKRFEGCPLKPGLQFFKMFADIKLEALRHLQRIIFPDSLINFDKLTWLKYDLNEKRYSIRSNDFILPFYLRKTKTGIEQYHNSELTWEEPMVIEKRFSPVLNQTFKTVMSEDTFQNYLLGGLEQSCVIQNYVRPAFANKPAFYRIIYRNQNIKQSKRKPNYGYLFSQLKQSNDFKHIESTVKTKILKKVETNKYKHANSDPSQTFTQKHIVNIDEDSDQYEVYMIRNFQVLEYRLEEMAQELVHFISVIYGFRVKQIVIDFIKDNQGNYFLIDVKNFTFDEFDKIRYLQMKDENSQIRQQNRIELLQRACMTAKCQLCKQKYRPTYVSNTITKKMLYKLNEHLTKRGVFLLHHLYKFQYQQEFCKVCDQCNQLVIAELELMEVERLYAKAQNIPSKEYNKIKKNDDQKIQVSSLSTNQLTQWRLMFLFKEIKGVTQSALLEQCQTGSLYIHLKILDFITTLEVCRTKVVKTQTSNFNNGQSIYVTPFNSKHLNTPGQNSKQNISDENRDQNIGIIRRNTTKDFKIIMPGLKKQNTFKNELTKDTDRNQTQDAQGNMNSKLNVIYEHQKDKKLNILVNKVRVHFFFTLEDNKEEFKKFLSNTEIEIRLTDGPYWEGQLLGTSTGFPLQYFNCKQEIQLQPWQYYFFGPINNLNEKQVSDPLLDDSSSSQSFISSDQAPKTKYESLIDFTVSLKKDQKVQISDTVDLHKVTGNVLFPNNTYFSPLPMPQEWIEIIQLFNNARNKTNSNKRYLSNQKMLKQSNNDIVHLDRNSPKRLDSNEFISQNKSGNLSKYVNNQSNTKQHSSNLLRVQSKENNVLDLSGNNDQQQLERDDSIITPKEVKTKFSQSLKIFQTVQDQNLLSKRMSTMNSVSPIFQKYNKSRNNGGSTIDKNDKNSNTQKDILTMNDLNDITDDQVLLKQLKLIDAKNQTLREVNTHYDPKFIYSTSQAFKKLQQLQKQKEKLAISQQQQQSKHESHINKFGGKQVKYKYKNYQIEQQTILEERKQITYQLKKKNYLAIKDIIESKKQQMLHIIPDDNFIVDQSPVHMKNKIQVDNLEDKTTPKNNSSQNQYGDHLTVSGRKNSLKFAKRPSMIWTKVSTDKLDVYNPLFNSQKSNNISQHSSGLALNKSASIVRVKNSNVIQKNTKNTNIFQVVSSTYKDYERQNKSLVGLDILTPLSKRSRSSSPVNNGRDKNVNFSVAQNDKTFQFKPIGIEEEQPPRKNAIFNLTQDNFNNSNYKQKNKQSFEDRIKNFNIQELDESFDLSQKSLNQKQINDNIKTDNKQQQKLKENIMGNTNLRSTMQVNNAALKPPKTKLLGLNKQERIQSAFVSNKYPSTTKNDSNTNSFLRTTFFNTHSKISKISPKKSSQHSNNTTLYANFLPSWINNNNNKDNIYNVGGRIIQIGNTITNNNIEIINNEIDKIDQYKNGIQDDGQVIKLDGQYNGDLDTINLLAQQYDLQHHENFHQYPPLNAKPSKKRRRQQKQKEFKNKYSGILLGDLRKDNKSLTRSQQRISKDLENSLKKTIKYQEQIIKVYGIDGEKQLIQSTQHIQSLNIMNKRRNSNAAPINYNNLL